jgi:hypothetical protein
MEEKEGMTRAVSAAWEGGRKKRIIGTSSSLDEKRRWGMEERGRGRGRTRPSWASHH